MTERSLKLDRLELPFIEQLNGDERGKIFELALERVTIGRSKDNNIVIISEAISRSHASVLKKGDCWVIEDLESKNGIQVNGEKLKSAELKNGDIIQIGDILFRFNDKNNLVPISQKISKGLSNYRKISLKPSKGKKINIRIIIWVTILAVGIVYLLSGSGEESVSDKTLIDKISSEKVFEKFKEMFINERRIIESPPGLEEYIGKAQREMDKLDWGNAELIEAEKEFKKGRRELEVENFHRAIEHFKTALTLFRGHSLAEIYLKISYKRMEQAARKQFEVGRQYFDSLQYQRAIFHFTQVVDLLSYKKNDKMVFESMKYIDICKKKLKAAELFP